MSIRPLDIPQFDTQRIAMGGDAGARASRDAFEALQTYLGQLAIQSANRIGSFVSVPYDAANFTTNSTGSWTVDAADVLRYRYIKIDDLMILDFAAQLTTVGNGTTTECRVKLPAGCIGAGNDASRSSGVWNNTGLRSMLLAIVQGGGNYVSCQRWDATGGAFPAVANDFFLGFVMPIEVLPVGGN